MPNLCMAFFGYRRKTYLRRKYAIHMVPSLALTVYCANIPLVAELVAQETANFK